MMLALYRRLINRDFILLIPLIALSLYFRLRYFFFLKSSEKAFPTPPTASGISLMPVL